MSKPRQKASSKRKPPNKHTANAKDETFNLALKKAPELKKWMQKEGIWIRELFEILVIEYKIIKTQNIKQKITSNKEFDDIIRKCKLKRNESNKLQEEMKRLDKNLLKFEKLWRNITGIQRKNQKVTFSVPPKKKALPPKPKNISKSKSYIKPKLKTNSNSNRKTKLKPKNISKSKSYVRPNSSRHSPLPKPIKAKTDSPITYTRHRRSSSIPNKSGSKASKHKSKSAKIRKKVSPKSPVPKKRLPPSKSRPGSGRRHNQTKTVTGFPTITPQKKRPLSANHKHKKASKSQHVDFAAQPPSAWGLLQNHPGLATINSDSVEDEKSMFVFPSSTNLVNGHSDHSQKPLPLSDGGNSKCRELETQGFEYCAEAENFEENKLFRKAIKFYNLGILKLSKTLNFIKKENDKKQRIQQIDGYKGKKQHCQLFSYHIFNGLQHIHQMHMFIYSTLNRDKLLRRESEKKGMEHCLLAEEYEKKQGYELAVKYYEKGIPFLMKSIENLDHKLSAQYKCNRIARYKNNLLKCKQMIGYNGTHNINIADGILFDYVGEGNIDDKILEASSLKDLYFVLPLLISSLSHIPISFKQCFRDKLVNKLNDIIETEPMLEQRLRCYLFSYSFDKNIYYNASLKSIYRYHPCMPQLAYNIFGDDNKENEDDIKYDKFESYYFERDCISFFRTLSNNLSLSSKLSNKLFGKQIIKQIDKDIIIYDLLGNNVEISGVEIKKVFKSNAKPILVRGVVNNEKSGYYNHFNDEINFNYIVKQCDDLRRDNAIMSMFKLMNYFWRKHGLKYNKNYDIQCLCYSVIPMGNDFGIIEFIENCVPLSDVNKLLKDDKVKSIVDFKKKSKDNNFLCKLVSTAAAAYIASFICGIRDRHSDNILIRKSDGSLFHIDFNYLWSKVGFIDAAKIAITKDLKNFMGDEHWNGFVDIASKAYLIIRKHFNEMISFCNIVFDFILSGTDKQNISIKPQQYLYNQLRIYMDDDEAGEYIRKKLNAAPGSYKTKLKNAIHKIAT